MDTADLIFAVVGAGAVVAALLPKLVDGRPLSLPIPFLFAGIAIGALPFVHIDADPADNDVFLEHLTEVVVIISLMGAGLGLDRRVGWRRWQTTWRLLLIAMPLGILLVSLLGWGLLGLAPAAAVLLGAVLSPTDPVLAGEVQVGEPASEPADADTAEDEVRFSLTSEAGLNDALAFPFVYFAIAMADKGTEIETWIGEWAAIDLLYRLAVGIAVGFSVGWLLGHLFFSSTRKVLRLAEHREGFVALAATFLTYGVAELLQGYGFLAVFVAAVTIRSTERFHGYHQILHRFIEQIERLLTVLVLLLLGMAIADGVLSAIGWREILLTALFLLIIRPLVAGVSLVRTEGSKLDRTAIAVFGVRGIGSIYYVAYAFAAAQFAGDQQTIYGTVALVVAASVVLHGISAGPIMKRLDARRD